MIYTGEMVLDTYSFEEKPYSNPRMKLSREVKAGKYIRLKRDLYETDKDVPKIALAQAIYGPSYISFDYALSFYGVIPEFAHNVTCATFGKHKDKVFETDICNYYYTDVPKKIFPIGIECRRIYGYTYHIATIEKALCDKLYKIPPVTNRSEFEELLFDDIRFDEIATNNLDKQLISTLSDSYRCRNVTMLERYLQSLEGLA
jgi:hypothetical protein